MMQCVKSPKNVAYKAPIHTESVTQERRYSRTQSLRDPFTLDLSQNSKKSSQWFVWWHIHSIAQAHVANRTPSSIQPCGSRPQYEKTWINLPIQPRPLHTSRPSSTPPLQHSPAPSTTMASSRDKSRCRQRPKRRRRD